MLPQRCRTFLLLTGRVPLSHWDFFAAQTLKNEQSKEFWRREQRDDCLHCCWCWCTNTMMVISLSQGSLFCNIPLMIILRRYSDSPKYCQDANTSSHNCVLATFSSLMGNIFLIVIIISTILEQRLLSIASL